MGTLKKIIGLMVLLLIISCTKEKVDEAGNPRILKESNCNGLPPQHLVTDLRYLGDIFCTYPCMNCFYEVVIIGHASDNDTTRAYNSFKAYFNNNDFENFFASGDYSRLFPFLSTDTANMIADGGFQMIKRQSTMNDSTELYILLYPGVSDTLVNDTTIFLTFQIKKK